jgi:cytochrome P450
VTLGCGVYLPAGTIVSMASDLIHHDDTIFPNPNEFIPDRFMGEKGKEMDKWLLSFSKGRTQCVGMK